MNGNSKAGKIALDYIIGRCRADKATKQTPSTFGITGWSAWVSPNEEKKDVLHILAAVPAKRQCYHFEVTRAAGKDLVINDRNGLADCYIADTAGNHKSPSRPSRPNNNERHRRPGVRAT